MTPRKLAAAIAALLALALGAYAEEGGGHGGGGGEKGGAAVPAVPHPPVLAPFKKQGLPPRETDPSWSLYQEGSRLFAQKRFGESLDTLKKAVEKRSELFGRCSADLDLALGSKEAKKAKDSLSKLLELLAARDLIPQDFAAIREKAGGSMAAEMRLLRETSPSSPLRGLVDAGLLVVEERGIARIGDSLSALKREVGNLLRYPEAEFRIGEVYRAEGELKLAELQFRKACDMADSLEVPGDKYPMLLALAEAYRAEGDDKNREEALREIADASDLFAAKDDYYRSAMERTLGERGFDKFMEMYRVGETFPIPAYSALGEMYLGDGRRIATIYLAAAVNAAATRAIQEIQVDEPGYEYSGLKDILARIQAEPDLADFAADKGLWKNLYLLGQALAQSGYRDSAKEIWSAVKSSKAPEPWKKRSAEALRKPFSASRSL